MVRIAALFSVVHASRLGVEKHEFVSRVSSPLEVCCLCFKETGEKTDWMIKTYDDDAQADLQGASFMQCRLDQGDGQSDCAAHCADKGFEMKGCMKNTGMDEWRSAEHWSAKTTAGDHSWTCETDTEGNSCGCGANSLLEVEAESSQGIEDYNAVVVYEEELQAPLEVCCLCFQETGEKTDWMIKTYADDAQADLQGESFMQCRLDQGDGQSDCSAHCAAQGYEMKGCMKGDGMTEWRQEDHWAAKTTAGQSSWNCKSDSETNSCACGANSLLEVEEEIAEESQMCTPYCVTKSNAKVGAMVTVYSRTYKMWCPGQIKAIAPAKGPTVHYTCSPRGKKPVNLKKMILWKEAGTYVKHQSMFR